MKMSNIAVIVIGIVVFASGCSKKKDVSSDESGNGNKNGVTKQDVNQVNNPQLQRIDTFNQSQCDLPSNLEKYLFVQGELPKDHLLHSCSEITSEVKAENRNVNYKYVYQIIYGAKKNDDPEHVKGAIILVIYDFQTVDDVLLWRETNLRKLAIDWKKVEGFWGWGFFDPPGSKTTILALGEQMSGLSKEEYENRARLMGTGWFQRLGFTTGPGDTLRLYDDYFHPNDE
jgi:hypothetical protein